MSDSTLCFAKDLSTGRPSSVFGRDNAILVAPHAAIQNPTSGNYARVATRDQWFYSVVTGTAAADILVSAGIPAVLKRIRNVGAAATAGTLRVSDGASTVSISNGVTSNPPSVGGTFSILPSGLGVNADVLFDGIVCATSLVLQQSNAADSWLVIWMPL